MEKPNNKYIDQLAGDDVEFRAKMVKILQKELPQEIDEYKSQFEANDLTRAALMVHKLKHKVSILGLEKSYYLAEKFEKNLKEGKTNFQEDFELLLDEMTKFVAQLK